MQNNILMENSQHTPKTLQIKFSVIYLCHILFHKEFAITHNTYTTGEIWMESNKK